MARIELFLTAKGGIGKTVCAVLLHEYALSRGLEVYGIDCDPNNEVMAYKPFSSPGGMTIIELPTKDEGGTVDVSLLDRLPGLVASFGPGPDTRIIVDCGAGGYDGLSASMVNGGYDELVERGHKPRLHITIPSGAQTMEVLHKTFDRLLVDLPSARLVVWLNPYAAGTVLVEGKPFVESDAYRQHKDQIDTVVELPALCHNPLFGAALQKHFGAHQTMDTTIHGQGFGSMVRTRISKFWGAAVKNFDEANLLG